MEKSICSQKMLFLSLGGGFASSFALILTYFFLSSFFFFIFHSNCVHSQLNLYMPWNNELAVRRSNSLLDLQQGGDYVWLHRVSPNLHRSRLPLCPIFSSSFFLFFFFFDTAEPDELLLLRILTTVPSSGRGGVTAGVAAPDYRGFYGALWRDSIVSIKAAQEVFWRVSAPGRLGMEGSRSVCTKYPGDLYPPTPLPGPSLETHRAGMLLQVSLTPKRRLSVWV